MIRLSFAPMTGKRSSTVFVVIEDDPAKRATTAERLCELKPLQIMFFETFRHARAFLAAVQMQPGVRVEIIRRQAIDARKPWPQLKDRRADLVSPTEVPA
jgi:hypothetical protein